ncbi:C-C motif chemokine 19 [Oryzias melastigma]|uniref:C-C motif chemokine 19 n=1 Tax=Oryzias melastigma TaxID=30732 RepID=A0A834FBJ4_ORYME|nr:C-C motif chemokine 8-like [Oryzias melastigma]KAF6728481.1 C-C motif chemokine 19 [Oryzias melastigma]
MAKLSACVFIMLVLLTTLNEKALARFCCTRYQKIPVPVDRLKKYTELKNTGNCHLRAIIFLTVKGKLVCANPNEEWVIEAMKTLKKKP